MWLHEIIDVRPGDGRKTGKGAEFETEADARVAFERFRVLGVKPRRVQFLLDLHNSNGDLLDTIRIDAAGFEAVTGAVPRSVEHYQRVDRAYWARTSDARV